MQVLVSAYSTFVSRTAGDSTGVEWFLPGPDPETVAERRSVVGIRERVRFGASEFQDSSHRRMRNLSYEGAYPVIRSADMPLSSYEHHTCSITSIISGRSIGIKLQHLPKVFQSGSASGSLGWSFGSGFTPLEIAMTMAPFALLLQNGLFPDMV